MARIRAFKIGFFRNEVLAELSPHTRLAFAGLWVLADKAGRLEDRPKRIHADLFPYEQVDMDAILADLTRTGFIVRYTVRDVRYIQIDQFTKHQRPHHTEQESSYPAPMQRVTKAPRQRRSATVKQPLSHGAETVKTSLSHRENPLGNGVGVMGWGNGVGEEKKEQGQDQREDAPSSHRVLVRLAHDVLASHDAALQPDSELTARLKDLAGKYQIPYSGREATKAIDSARAARLNGHGRTS